MRLITKTVVVEESFDKETLTVLRETITTTFLLGLAIWRAVDRENLKPVLNRTKPFRYR